MRNIIQFTAGTVAVVGLSSLILLTEPVRADKEGAAKYPVVEKMTHKIGRAHV